ncbi:MAG: PQQ-binding-like beta-propeller repeat protein [Fuerstiella sp.]
MLFANLATQAEDWNQFRGPNRDNLSTETGLADDWPSEGPRKVMTITGLGEGYSTVSVVGNTLFTMGNVDGAEQVIAIDRKTGKVAWRARNGNEYQEGQGNGPRGTPTVVGGKVYALGGNGDLGCYDQENGNVIWQKNILSEFGGENITWGISESVLIDGSTLICTPGGRRATVVALNANTGDVKWRAQVPNSPQASYASAMMTRTGRIKQYVVFTSKGIVGIHANTGAILWGHDKCSNGTANCATPLVFGRWVFSSSDYGTGAELIELRSSGSRVVSQAAYHTRDMKNHHGGMVHLNGFVYGSNADILACLDLKTGKPTWRERSMKGSVVYADKKIVFRHEDGDVVLLAANSRSYQELGRFAQPDRSGRPAWSHPVIANGQLYLRDMDKLLVYDLK